MKDFSFQMRLFILVPLLAALGAGTGCLSQTAEEERTPRNNEAPSIETITSIEAFEKALPFALQLKLNPLEKGEFEKAGHQLVAHLDFESGSYVVSPTDMNRWTGPFQLSFEPSTKLAVTGPLTEWPSSTIDVSVPGEIMKVNATPTIFTLPFEVIGSGDFEVDGSAFFVFEPLCQPFVQHFTLSSQFGELQLTTEAPRIEYPEVGE
jgi:hypothetical protein